MKQTIIIRGAASLSAAIQRISGIPLERPWMLTIEHYRKKRSSDANAYYWSQIVTPLAQHLGYSPEELHTEICGSYFGWKTVEFRGHTREVPRRTTTTPDTLGTMEFADFIAHAHSIAADMGCPISSSEAA